MGNGLRRDGRGPDDGWRTTVRSTPHSAPGQAAGYQYQSEQALLALIRRRQPRVTLFIEQLDDFHFEAHENALDIVQVKHHIGGGGDLTDTSADLWRTINAWITILDLLEVDEIASFFLLTTSTAAPGSILLSRY